MTRVTIFAADHPPTDFITDIELFPQRDNVIRHLVGRCGWPRASVAAIFGLTKRHVERISSRVLLRLSLIITDLELFPQRDNVIRHLVGRCGWPRASVAAIFGLSDRHFQRIVNPSEVRLDLAIHNRGQLSTGRRNSASLLSPKEIETMVRDYALDPYITAAEREAAWIFIEQGCPPTPV